MDELVAAVHAALNATAVRRRPDEALLPARGPVVSRPLPVPPRPTADLGRVLARRRSAYAFGGAPDLRHLAALLHHGVGSAPRAGALPSLAAYVVTRGLDGLPGGVHLADLRPPAPGLVRVRSGDPTAYVADALDQPPFAARVPLWVALVADLEVSLRRYPPRHYRTLHVDAGAALQTLLLVATALDLPVCPVMGYDDRAWARLLDLDEHRLVTVLVAVGGPPTRPG